MPVEIKLPELGDGIESADVLEVLVSVGDTIAKDDGIVELETDKATAVVPTPKSGVIKEIKVAEGDTVSVGTVLLMIDEADGSANSSAEPQELPSETAESVPAKEQPKEPTPEPPAPTPEPPAPVVSREQKTPEPIESVPASSSASFGVDPNEIAAGPAMRRFAREVGVNLGQVTGTGPGGRITRNDILGVVRAGGAKAQPQVQGQGQQDEYGNIRVEKLSRMRRTIANQMTQSWTTVPRVTNFDDADVTDLENIRQTSKADYAARGIKLTSMPFIIKACAMALRDHPVINASLSEDSQHVVYKEYVNIGVAVDTERGLVVPSMRNADELSIPQIASHLSEMAEKVRMNDFSVEDLRGGTFTISNLGAIGGTYSTPIINVPENAIILVGRSRKMPVVVGDEILPRLMMPLSISYDHRLVDGAAAARFLNDVIGYLEAPSRLLLAP